MEKTMKNIDVTKFSVQNAQIDQNHCIPANIQAMILYHDPHYSMQQAQIMTVLNNNPSFGVAQVASAQLTQNQTVTKLDPQNINDWTQNIKDEIDQNRPIAISTNIKPGKFHIRTLLGYDDTYEFYLLQNPSLQALMVNQGGTPVGYIIGGLEIYTYNEAQNDWKIYGGGTDQLQII